MRPPHEVAVTAGLPERPDYDRFKAETGIYENIGHPRWEAARRAYTEVTARSAVW